MGLSAKPETRPALGPDQTQSRRGFYLTGTQKSAGETVSCTSVLPVTRTGLPLGGPEIPSGNETVTQRQRMLLSSGSGNSGTAQPGPGTVQNGKEVIYQDGGWGRALGRGLPCPHTASFLPGPACSGGFLNSGRCHPSGVQLHAPPRTLNPNPSEAGVLGV